MTQAPFKRIRLLSDHLANKIAAGEVVERPASVLKELVENAIDAGATRVDVRLGEGGRSLVEVRDDGGGMGPDDARMCLERHATSKLADEEGLFDIRTLGFRGEALPSIASVSRLTLLTRPPGALEGTRLEVEAGRVVSQGSAGAPEGTTVRVADLFHNVPARRKFLRRPATELGHASEALIRLALAHPQVGFSLEHDGRRLFSSAAGDPLDERIAAALGRDVHPHLHPVDGGAGDLRVWGYLAAPSVTRTSSRGVYTFVNRRFVRDRQISHAVVRSYQGLVDRARSPVVVLFIEVPPAAVDVNVHPQKLEVRFSEARAVYSAVASALGRVLAAAPWREPDRRYALAGDTGPGGGEDHRARVLDALERFAQTSRPRPAPTLTVDLFARRGPVSEGATAVLREGLEAPELAEAPGFFASLRVIGQLRASFILCEGPEGMVVVDQHAAHERVEFERLKALWQRREVVSQPLLVPRTLSLPLAEAQTLEDQAEHLATLGFDVSHLGGGALALRAVPAVLGDRDPERLVRELATDLADLESDAAFERAVDRLLATVACHSVVRFGDHLSVAEAEALLGRMDAIPFNANCPHGRPVAFALDFGEIERRFQRR